MSGLVAGCSLKELFRQLLTEASSHQKLSLAEITEFYVVNLLSEFAAADKLFGDERDGRKDTEPLAILYHRALQQEREGRIRTLRRLGDVSLYKAGFFSDSLREQAVGADYYIEMGGAAYGQVASLSPPAGFGEVFQELHHKFRALVEVLEEIAARGLVATGPSGTLQVFKSWAKTGNERLEQVLAEVGVVPPKKGLPN
ncbi:MAG: hypothetical protein ACYC8T_27405 [Myxococcaceae bacterium]